MDYNNKPKTPDKGKTMSAWYIRSSFSPPKNRLLSFLHRRATQAYVSIVSTSTWNSLQQTVSIISKHFRT